jgi:thymidylate kinase
MAIPPHSGAATPHTLGSLRLPEFGHPAAGPVVIAIEGSNGAGKTTLSWALSEKLGVPWCLGTDEAWAADHLKVRMIRDADWFASAMFFLSGCFEQTRLLRQRTDRAIIMDRCLWSTLAVHAAADTNHLCSLLDMLRPVAPQVQTPNLTLVLDASFATCQTRIARKTGTARALDELTANAQFHAKEAEFYQWLGRESDSVAFLDVNEIGADQVAQNALALIQARIPAI